MDLKKCDGRIKMSRKVILSLLLSMLFEVGFLAQSPQPADYGKPAPKWLLEGGTFSGGYVDWTEEGLDRLKAFPLVITTTHSREIVEKLHQRGVRAIFYINPYVAYSPSGIRRELQRRKELGEAHSPSWYPALSASPFFQALDFAGHPEWIWVGSDGYPRKERATYEETPHDIVVARQMCPNSPGYREAALGAVKTMLDAGADGFFIDCDEFYARPRCYGPDFKLHQHAKPEWDNSQAWLAVQKEIYEQTKARGEERVVLINGWGPQGPADYLRYADGYMLESYIVTHVSTRRASWESIQAIAKQTGPVTKAGKVVLALSYVGYTPKGMDEDAFYSYACARLFGYAWSDYFTLADARSTLLYRLRLGAARSEVLESNGMLYRLYEKGVVVLNPTNIDRELKVKSGFSFLREALTNRRYHPHDEATMASLETEELQAVIPAESGRVFVPAED
jgi:hypothetical protein